MKVKVSEKEVRWLLNGKINKGSQANQMLKKTLGEDLSVHFAEMQLGSNVYIWEWEGDDWKKCSEVSLDESNIVEAAIENVRQAINSRTTMANVLLTVPNRDYIFYRITESGDVNIKYAGWGFNNYKVATGGRIARDITKQKNTQKIRVAFSVDGLPISNREFYYKFPHMQKENLQMTGNDGFYTFDTPLVVGDGVTVTDRISGKSFMLTPTLGKEDYIYDVTQYTAIGVTVKLDNNPLPEEQVILRYNEKEYILQTNEMGIASTQLPYISNLTLELEVRKTLQNHLLNRESNQFNFSFETPRSTAPIIIDIPVCVSVTENNRPIANEQVTFLCNGQNISIPLNEHGKASVTFPYMEGSSIVVIVRDVHQQQVLNKNGNKFDYTFERVVKPKVNLQVEESEGIPLKECLINLKQGTNILNCQLDANGKCSFDSNIFRYGEEIEAVITDKSGHEIRIPFVMEEKERDYLLIGQIKKKSPWMTMLELMLLILAIITLYLLGPSFCDLAETIGRNIF